MHRDKNKNRITNILMAVALAGLVSIAMSGEAQAKGRGGCNASHTGGGYGALGNGVFPNSCWRPYAEESPFNDKISRRPHVKSGSDGVISQLTSSGPAPSYFVAGDEARDWGVAMYYSDANDPVWTVRCTEPWGTCAVEGARIHLPEGAEPSGVWPLPSPHADYDSHLTVVDQTTGWEYDLWNIRSMKNGVITIKWGGKTRVDGDGLGSDAVAARFGAAAGLIRAEELREGKIDHALSLTVPCTVGHTWPALKGALECADAGMPTNRALQNGDLLQLKLSRKRIARFPKWKSAILAAWKKYGAYVGDTTGDASQWALKFESAAGYLAEGAKDPLVDLARDLNFQPADYNGNGQDEFWFDIGGGVDWKKKLRVVKPGT